MKTRAGVCHEAGGSWQIEEVDIGEPHAHEVQVEMAYAGLCHSDEHVRRGEMVPAPEIMELLGISSMFPLIGGHEGSGVVTAVGPEVATVEVGDKVATSFIPACGTCFWCASGRQNLCDYGLY
ncbi:MAG: alcohol dehydrogenase catalytic domain-containing protein, partial [Acidimicrobiales bacterium]